MEDVVRSVLMVSQPTVAGAAQCVADWADGLRARGWRVAVACPGDGWLGRVAAEAGVEVFHWDAVHEPHRGLVGEFNQLSSILADFRPDVVHLNGAKAGLVGRQVVRGRLPTAFSPHSWSTSAADGIKSRAALLWERAATRWTDVIISVSEGEAAEGRGLGIDGRYVVARNGVDVTTIAPLDPATRHTERLRRGIDREHRVVVCVGRLHRQKGHDILLSAWPTVANGGRTLYLVGEGPLAAELRTAHRRADVVFTGGVERAEALLWMQVADLVVVPSRWEGMALVPLEALAVGTPLVITDVTGASETVTDDCGQVVPRHDPAALAAGMQDWLNRTPDQLAEARTAARQRAVTSFALSDTVDRISDTLTSICRTGD